MAAGLGFEATGLDSSSKAIEIAERKARGRNQHARFLVWSALELPSLGERFDTVLDSGLFHVFDDGDRARYVTGLREVNASGGRLFLLCFGDRQPGVFGPRRVSEDEIRSSFEVGWRVDAIEEAGFEIAGGRSAHAWLASLTRL